MVTEKTKEAAPKEALVAADAVKNCAGCSKPMRKAKRYYRNGKYYCNKKCFKSAGAAVEKKE